jgi:hypothetical protein
MLLSWKFLLSEQINEELGYIPPLLASKMLTAAIIN